MSAGKEHLGRRTDLNLDLRLLGAASKADIFESAVYLFDCEGQESSIGTIFSGDVAEYREKYLPTRNLAEPPLRSLSAFPREHYKNSKVGTIVALRENPMALKISAYWSAEAFDIAMQHLVQISRDLIEDQTIPKSELRGRGVLSLKRASTLANCIYQAVSDFCITNHPNEILNGVSALEVFKSSNTKFSCRISLISLVCDEQVSTGDVKIGNFETKAKVHRIFEVDLKRDQYGFLERKISNSFCVPFFNLKWTDHAKDIIEEDHLEGLI